MDNEETKCNSSPEGEDCPKHKKKCCKTEEKKRKKGMYGLEDEGDRDDATEDNGSMPQDNANEELNPDVHLKDMSNEKKQKAMDSFRERSAEAAKRKKDKDRSDELSSERLTKGIRFFDSKGSGYIKKGKKSYD